MTKINDQSNTIKRPRRRTLIGTITALSAPQTAIVQTEQTKQHPKYEKRYMRSKKYHAQTGKHKVKVGQVVTLVEDRPRSSLKRWRIKV